MYWFLSQLPKTQLLNKRNAVSSNVETMNYLELVVYDVWQMSSAAVFPLSIYNLMRHPGCLSLETVWEPHHKEVQFQQSK